MRLAIALLCLLATCSSALGEQATFTFLKTVSIQELNEILSTERDKFLADKPAPDGYEVPAYSKASNDVELYVVHYLSRSPDLGNKKRYRVSGLLALPRIADQASLPLISYQHGTVERRYEVPSYAFRHDNPSGEDRYAAAYETRYMVGLYAGNGYAVMAADYFGKGDSSIRNEAYMMKRSTAQVNYDLYLDVRKFLAAQDIGVSRVLLGGWSQGGLNTTGLLEVLERRGVEVDAAFTAAAPNDPFAALNAVFFHPRSLDAPWINLTIALTIFSCEKYRGPANLAKLTIDPPYYELMRAFYERTPFDFGKAKYPASLVGYLRPELRDPSRFANSAYGKCLAENETYRQEFKTPLRMYYGSSDEVIRLRVGRLAHEYQETLVDTPDTPSSNRITPVLVEGGDHRRTFISGAVLAKSWLDGLP